MPARVCVFFLLLRLIFFFFFFFLLLFWVSILLFYIYFFRVPFFFFAFNFFLFYFHLVFLVFFFCICRCSQSYPFRTSAARPSARNSAQNPLSPPRLRSRGSPLGCALRGKLFSCGIDLGFDFLSRLPDVACLLCCDVRAWGGRGVGWERVW